MNFSWTGIRRERSGKVRRTGFEARFLGMRFSTFTIPGRDFDKRKRRFALEAGPLHVLVTWGK